MGVEPRVTLENCWVWLESKKEKGQLAGAQSWGQEQGTTLPHGSAAGTL